MTEPLPTPRWRGRFETASAVLTAAAASLVMSAVVLAFGRSDLPNMSARLDVLVLHTGMLPGLLLLVAAALLVMPEVAGEPPSKAKGVGVVVSAIAVVGLVSTFIGLTGVLLAFTADAEAAVRIARPLVDIPVAAVSATAVWLAFRQGGR